MTPLGSLGELLERTPATRNILRSPGPVADQFVLSADPVAVIEGPQGSAKTTSCAKKSAVEAQRIRPGPDGVRRYVLGVWRRRYDDLWKSTIPSWWKVFPKDLDGSKWIGASPRAAEHTVNFRDAFGPIELTARFLAFGEVASPEDLRGMEFTDVWLNEFDTLPEELVIYLIGRIGRSPPAEISGRQGRVFGDMNAPDVTSSAYRDLHEALKQGYALYRQPGGRDPGAENLQALGPGYYEQQAMLNAHRPWWIRRMIDNIPGFTRDTDLVYPAFDDVRMRAAAPLAVYRERPVLVGIDGALTPAAVYMQEMPDGQLRVLAEVALERGGPQELARAMLALEEERFQRCEFRDVCDPSLLAGEDTEDGSYRRKLEKHLGRKVTPARTNNPTLRWEAVRVKLALNLDAGRPGFLLDPQCKILLRGFLQTYHFRKTRGTTDLSSVQSAFETHVHDGLQAGALECGTAAASQRTTDITRKREERRKETREAKRYSPFQRRQAR